MSGRSETAAMRGELTSRVGSPTQPASAGLQPLGLDGKRDGLLYVPPGYQLEQPAPLVLMLHGAGGSGRGGLAPFLPLADRFGTILLAPDARLSTWDVLKAGYGPDVAFINQALDQTFERYAVDPGRVAVEGFSDGASYALSLGIGNGELFSHIIAFSPGFMAPARQEGAPRIYLSHGVHDRVLPVDRCSRKIVPRLKRAGYDVRYHEFNGPHTVPAEIALEAMEWFASP